MMFKIQLFVLLTDLISRRGFKHMTVSDSWSVSRRRKSTASSGVGYCETINALFLRKDWKKWMCGYKNIPKYFHYNLWWCTTCVRNGGSCLFRQVTANKQTNKHHKIRNYLYFRLKRLKNNALITYWNRNCVDVTSTFSNWWRQIKTEFVHCSKQKYN